MKPVNKIITALVTQSNTAISSIDLIGLSREDLQKVENALSQLKRNAKDAKKKRLANKALKQWKSLCVKHGLDYEEEKKAKHEDEAEKVKTTKGDELFKKYKWRVITVLSILALFILPLKALYFFIVFTFPMFLIGLLALTNEGDWSWTKTEKWPWQRRIFYLASFWIVAGFTILTDDYTPSSSSSYSSSSSSSSSSNTQACIAKSERQFESCLMSIPGNASESDMNYCLDLHEARSYGCRTGRRK